MKIKKTDGKWIGMEMDVISYEAFSQFSS